VGRESARAGRAGWEGLVGSARKDTAPCVLLPKIVTKRGRLRSKLLDMPILRGLTLGALTILATSCAGGGSSSSTPSTPSGGDPLPASCTNLPNSTTFLLANDAVCPKNITVPPGTQVTFVNNDVIVHQIDSDPHPEHTDCPEINQVGFLSPGQSRQTGNLNTVRACGFHDHLAFENKNLQGTITIH
jgi:hypothetical protein